MNGPSRIAALLLCLGGALSAASHAEERRLPHEGAERFRPEAARASGLHLDTRYHHDHYYPRPGVVVGALPSGSFHVDHDRDRFYFHGGVWFRPFGPRFIVTVPPIGIVIPWLPPAVVTLWIAGAPYYYANGVYYAPSPGQGYQVVAPPAGADVAAVAPAPLVVYPRAGQSAAQTDDDRQACSQWAGSQPGAAADGQLFQRAQAACLEGRGYSVR